MGGLRTFDDYYEIGPNPFMSYHRVKLDVAELWHQRLGHLNFKYLYRASKEELMLDLPKLWH
jgi:hypothetical protein